MPADPAAPVTEPRAELVEAAAKALNGSDWQKFASADHWRNESRRVLTAVLPLLTLADLPAARQAEHEQQIRAKVAREIEAIPTEYVRRWQLHGHDATSMRAAAADLARGTEGGTR